MAYPSKNKNASIDINAILSGAAHLETVRGLGSWGAGWIFGASGLTNDVKVLADTFKYLSTSGTYATDAELLAASGVLRTAVTSLQTSSGHLHEEVIALQTTSGFLATNMSGVFRTDITNLQTASGHLHAEVLELQTTSGYMETEITNLSGYIAAGTMPIVTYAALNVFSGFLGSGQTNLVPSWSEFTGSSGHIHDELHSISGYYQSGNISTRIADAMPSGGFYIHAGDNATGLYHVYVVASGVGFGQFSIVVV